MYCLFGAIGNVSKPPVEFGKLLKHFSGPFPRRGLSRSCGIAAVAALVLCSCDKLTVSQPKRFKVGFAQIANEGPWRETNSKSIKDEALRRNIELVFFESQNRELTGG